LGGCLFPQRYRLSRHRQGKQVLNEQTKRLNDIPQRDLFRIAFWGTVILVAYLSFGQLNETPIANINDKFGHTAAFLCLAFLLDFATARQKWGWSKALPLLAYGLLIEIVQYHLPYREFSLWDLAADGLGLLIYPVSYPLLRHLPVLAPRWNSATN
jgi:VanZ family protein